MLTNSAQLATRRFKQILEELQMAIITDCSPEELQSIRQIAQNHFQGTLMQIPQEEWDADDNTPVQPFLTETHRQLRLLTMDMQFLQASRQASTTQQRLAQIKQRIATLIEYCDQIQLG
ncbi:MAG: heterocyst frequency control protein PatD [Microcoleaceae cyanobacterium]